MMAKRKETVKVILPSPNVRHFYIWVDNPANCINDVLSVEGVYSASINTGGVPISVVTDPRYDIVEIADEVEQLLNAEIPDVFREDE